MGGNNLLGFILQGGDDGRVDRETGAVDGLGIVHLFELGTDERDPMWVADGDIWWGENIVLDLFDRLGGFECADTDSFGAVRDFDTTFFCAEIVGEQDYVAVTGKPMRLLVQAVGARVRHQFDRPWGAGEARQGRLVVIAEHDDIRRDVIEAALGTVRQPAE